MIKIRTIGSLVLLFGFLLKLGLEVHPSHGEAHEIHSCEVSLAKLDHQAFHEHEFEHKNCEICMVLTDIRSYWVGLGSIKTVAWPFFDDSLVEIEIFFTPSLLWNEAPRGPPALV